MNEKERIGHLIDDVLRVVNSTINSSFGGKIDSYEKGIKRIEKEKERLEEDLLQLRTNEEKRKMEWLNQGSLASILLTFLIPFLMFGLLLLPRLGGVEEILSGMIVIGIAGGSIIIFACIALIASTRYEKKLRERLIKRYNEQMTDARTKKS